MLLRIPSLVFVFFALSSTGLTAPTQKRAGDVIPGQYIVVLKDEVDTNGFSAHQEKVKKLRTAKGNKIAQTYTIGNYKAYSGNFEAAAIEEIATLPEVAYVEPDKVVLASALVTQSSVPSWGLARISHRNTGYTSYIYDSTAGNGITAYVVDTGILTTHVEFGGRATIGYNAISGESGQDLYGHGTHVAGTIAGTNVGISKNAYLISVKVLDQTGSGTTSGVIAGVNFVVSDAQSKGIIGNSLANMSLGGGYSSALNSAVTNAVNAGVPFAVAAGNDHRNAANTSPASATAAITVGATTNTDARASYSNYGSVLDIFAPGSSIYSSTIGSDTTYAVFSGTSMASPHVCGVAAYLMSYESLTTPAQVVNRLIALATLNKVTNPGSGSPNRLLYNGSGY